MLWPGKATTSGCSLVDVVYHKPEYTVQLPENSQVSMVLVKCHCYEFLFLVSRYFLVVHMKYTMLCLIEQLLLPTNWLSQDSL